MKTLLHILLVCGLISLLALAGLPVFAEESYMQDGEAHYVKDGILGTVNVLRELDVKTWTNLVTATSNVKAREGDVNNMIDGSAAYFLPELNATKPFILTFTLPGLRTVSALVIDNWHSSMRDIVRLEGSSDGGATWSQLFKSETNEGDKFLRCFKPARVNALRLTQEGPRQTDCKIREVLAFADPDVPLPLFGGKDTGAFSFLRELWYSGKAKLVGSPMKSGGWTLNNGERAWPHVPFQTTMGGDHQGFWGRGPYGEDIGKYLFFRLDLDKAYPMEFGLISGADNEHIENNLAGKCLAEFYTANGNLDPAKLASCSSQDLTGQGWILQKSWKDDGSVCKSFRLEHPGKYNQMLLVWPNQGYNIPNGWSHMEMFGCEMPDAGDMPNDPQK